MSEDWRPPPGSASFLTTDVLLPIAFGAGIYVLFRSTTLRVFDWIAAVGLGPAVERTRSWALPQAEKLPEWFLYSLPDGLWVYALTAFMAWLWADRLDEGSKLSALPWVASGLALGCGGELLQIPGIVPGTFDIVDLLLSAGAGALAFARVYWRKR